MKYIFSLLLFSAATAFAQKETFDLAAYAPPKGWKKQAAEGAIQFSKEDAAKGTYCLITLFKAVQGTANSKENFDLAWTSLVKEMVTVSAPPEMQPVSAENGWEVQSGYAPFEKEDNKGVVILVTSSSFEKMITIIILTNTDVYEKNITDFLGSVTLKKQAAGKPGNTVTKNSGKAINQPVAVSDGFAFTTTNFDNGWTSTVQEDWVEVTKESSKVLIHYPNKNADAYHSVLLDGLKNAWNILVAPRYSSASDLQFKSVSGWQAIEYADATMVEKTTGKTVYVVLFKKDYSDGTGKYLEFIAPDKNTFEKEFGAYHTESYGWDKMETMATYNKFAIAAADLAGKWTNDFSGAIQYVNASTGFDAGMATHASSENFKIGPGNVYKWDLGVASGAVGNIKFQSVKSSGKFSVSGNWQVSFSDIGGKPRTYNAYFSCIKGLRILWLDNRAFAKVD